MTYLLGESAGTKITKRKFESSVGSLNIDLESNQSILVCWGYRSHGVDDQS